MADSCRVTTEPTKLREYESKHGPLVVWGFDLEGQGAVELHKKPGNDPPAVNTMILVEDKWQGEFDGETYTRIKLANEGGFNSGGGGPRGRSPADTKAIQRQHSQEMALRFLAATGSLAELELDERELVGTVLNQQVRPLIDWFERDIAS